MGVAVGIDLGTTNTVVAAVKEGVAATLADAEGNKLIPSVVAFHPNGTVQVGAPALERRIIDPENTIYSVKRLIGRSFASAEVTEQRPRFPFTLVEGAKSTTLVQSRGEAYALPEISAFVLRRAKAIAESALGETVDRAVITVPANFDDLQRASTKVAGKIAGLEVLRILNEPTAAALAYGRSQKGTERVCVYDLGGGTFDVTLLDVAGGVYEVLATAGDTSLGGDDIDAKIMDRMRETALRTLRVDPTGDPSAVARMRVAAERLKRDLSTRDEVSVQVEKIGRGQGGAQLTLTFTLTRAELERLAMPLVAHTIDVTRSAMKAGKIEPGAIDRVILVGGSTRMPLVVRQVRELFGKNPDQRINPDEVVALGAAVQAHALGAGKRAKKGGRKAPEPAQKERVRIAVDSLPPEQLSHAVTGAKRSADAKPGKGTRSAAPPAPTTRTKRLSEMKELRAKRFDPRAEPEDNDEPEPPTARIPIAELEKLAASSTAAEPAAVPGSSRSSEARAPSLPGGKRPAPPAQEPVPPPLFTPVPDLPDPAAARKTAPNRPAPRTAAAKPAALPKPSPPPPPSAPPIAAEDLEAEIDPAASLLIDVTPLSLRVETVGGFSDVLIGANSPVPCDRTRVFSTAADGQTQVFIRVAQGENAHFRDNTFLGELELSGLVALPRGEARIAVTFEIDADGILAVRAKDGRTGNETAAKLHVVGAQTEEGDLARMARRQAQRAVV